MARKLRLAVCPSDWILLALLTLAAIVAIARWPAVGEELSALVAIQLGLLAAMAIYTAAALRWQQSVWLHSLRPWVTVTVVFTLYSSLGKLGITAMPYLADGWLSWTDNRLLGFDPSLAIQRFQTRDWVEFFSFVYGAFIPYIYLSMFLGCLGRPPLQRGQFLAGWVLTYAISYLGYIFLPAQGPVVYQAQQYEVALHGGLFYRLVVWGNEATGGLHGAFPACTSAAPCTFACSI